MVELLAPAGNIESLKSAVFNSADAVYLGLDQFNARIKADNFTTHNIREWVDFCHLYNVKVYVTLNISIKQSEFYSLIECIKACNKACVDALIITDLAILDYAKEYAPDIPLHASTQLGIHNYLGAKYAERLGFTRIVLSREASLDDIKEIKATTNLEIEYFVHGAVCVSFSGGCLLSSMASGNSGNRGLCLQPCRKLYSNSLNNTESYILSPKDQCLIDNCDQLIECGVNSFKIEGRLKSPQYIASTVLAYRKQIDTHTYSNIDMTNMKKTFNRGGFFTGYAFSQNNEIMCKTNQNHIGIYVGEIIDSRPNNKGCYDIVVKSSHKFANGDGCKVMYNNIEVGGFETSIIKSTGDIYTLYSRHYFSFGSKVYLTNDKILNEQLLAVTRRINLKLDIKVKQNSLNISTAIATFGGATKINYTQSISLEYANNSPLTIIEFVKQFSKTLDTPFNFEMNVDIDNQYFVPKSILNQMRRDFVAWLANKIICINNSYHKHTATRQNFNIKNAKLGEFIFEIGDELRLDKLGLNGYDIVIDFDKFESFILNNTLIENKCYIKLPKLALNRDIGVVLFKLRQYLSKPYFGGIYADNIYGLEIAKQLDIEVIGGFGLNIFNSKHATNLGLLRYCVSPELNEMEVLEHSNDSIIYAYGYLQLMTFGHCPIVNILGCKCSNCGYKKFYIQDKYGKYNIERTKIINCSFTMYNNSCHNLLNKNSIRPYTKYIDLSNLEESSIQQVIDSVRQNKDISTEPIYTNGHFLRGVK